MSTSNDAMNRTNGAIHDENNIKGFFGEFRWLSNFHPVEIEYDELVYPSVEAAYMAQKTTDHNIRKQFTTLGPKEAKKLGRSIKLRDGWEDMKLGIMHHLNTLKYAQEPLKSMLLSTGNKYLEETNWWNDKCYGVCNGVGENNLGKIIMKIRDSLQE